MRDINKRLIDYLREEWGVTGEVLWYRENDGFAKGGACHAGNEKNISSDAYKEEDIP